MQPVARTDNNRPTGELRPSTLLRVWLAPLRVCPLVPAVAVVAVVAPALERTTAAAATVAAGAAAIATVFTGLGYRHTDRPAVNGSAVQFLDSLLGCFVIGHFYKCKSAGLAGKFVHNDLSRRNFAVFCKIIL